MNKKKIKSGQKKSEDKNTVTNVLITGVGGQGILLASDLLSLVALEEGFDVKKSEVHGMAQRGGSVNSHIRFGKKIFSPIIPFGEVDFLLAFEALEALRSIRYLRKNGVCIFNSQRLIPVSSFISGIAYPEEIKRNLIDKGIKTFEIDAISEALKLKNIRVTNLILLGVLSRYLPFKKRAWKSATEKSIKPDFLDINMKAFEIGKSILGGYEENDLES